MNLMVTGAAGFIGSNFVKYVINNGDDRIVSYDALTYAGNLLNLEDLPTDRHAFIQGNICDANKINQVISSHQIDGIVHFAAESHVDRSIMNSDPFVQTNVVGTQRLLDAAKLNGCKRFIHVSTDEVYGSLSVTDPAFTESHAILPNSPYAASKAASDLMVRSYIETFDFPAIITRCSNNYGPYQFPEKLIPLMIQNATRNQPLPVYGNGQNIRDWLHVRDHCAALHEIFKRGKLGDIYNIGGHCELKNIDIVEMIIDFCGASSSLITYVDDRLGHDFRYAMNTKKLQKELNVMPQISFEEGLRSTVEWYKQNTQWLSQVTSKSIKKYQKEAHR